MSNHPVTGAGLGLRRALLGPLRSRAKDSSSTDEVDFWEVAPENWINVGGRLGRTFRSYTEKHPFVCHGLSLSIGGPSALDETFLQKLKHFLDTHNIRAYSDHLSYCTDDGHLYDLMPIPFTEEAVNHVVERIARSQEILGRRIAVENVSYYAAPGKEMDEITFINEILTRADCDLLLDVNNIYVNSVNHRYDASEFLAALPGERITYCHVAGHYNEAEDLIVDTHGAAIIEPVWELYRQACALWGPLPAMVERDFNFPPLDELMGEVETIRKLQRQVGVEIPATSAHAQVNRSTL
ncbi:MAG: DUF692 domain-containing protein [Lysobacterales bacterium]